MFAHIATWWAGLSWSQAALIVFSILMLWVAAFLVASQCAGFNDRPLPPRRRARDCDSEETGDDTPWPIADYSQQYREKSDWLGADHLLATPVNRIRGGSHEVGRVVRFERTQR